MPGICISGKLDTVVMALVSGKAEESHLEKNPGWRLLIRLSVGMAEATLACCCPIRLEVKNEG